MSGFIGLLSLAGFFTLVSYRLLPALIISFFLFAVCVVWQIVWFDSRHFSRVVTFAISQIRPWTLLLISLVSSIATALSYAGFLAVLYSLKRIWDTAVPGCTKDRNLYTSRFIAAIILLSATTYWFTHVISSFAHILGAIVAKNHVILNVQKESGQSSIQRKQIRAMLRSTYNSVCYGAGLVSYTVFLKDLVIGLGQNISLGPTSPFLSITGALLLTVLTFIGPFHGALDRTNSPWTFSMMALDSTKYWHASKAGAALMSAAGLNILKETGLFQMIEYFPVLIGVVSAVSTFLLVTLIPGPIVEYNDILVAEVLVAFAYFGGSQISRAAFAPFNGAMCTIFVMMAREPAIFQEHYGVVWTRLEEFNPSVAEALLK
ncbi:Bcpie2 [Botrytis cinerea B05.10]|nr:Bcpie2 [Botrytis cinerea B05.10]ATZ58063.1 Bcpie2 [Botrytis cinerea B05.10]